MRSSTLETLIGAGMLAVAALVLGLAYGKHGGPTAGYDLVARFNRSDGIGLGSPVLLSGENVGTVTAQKLDNQFRSVLTLHINPGTEIPTESTAAIQTDGILGGKFIALLPGGGDDDMKPGSEFDTTQDSVSLNEILALILGRIKSTHGAPAAPAGH